MSDPRETRKIHRKKLAEHPRGIRGNDSILQEETVKVNVNGYFGFKMLLISISRIYFDTKVVPR